MGLSSCLKDKGDVFDSYDQFQAEIPQIQAYVRQHIPTAKLDSVYHIWYRLEDAGQAGSYTYKTRDSLVNGVNRTYIVAPEIRIKFTGRLLDGTIFQQIDDKEGSTRSLADEIFAWQYIFLPQQLEKVSVKGLFPKGLQKGAKIRFVTPSLHAFGNQAYNGIPANSPLDFELEVLDIK